MADWANLSADLIRCIHGCLEDLMDQMSFRCACVSWQHAVDGNRPLPPLLILPASGDGGGYTFLPLVDLVSYAQRRSRKNIRLPWESTDGGLVLMGSAAGWVVAADQAAELHLLNPITRAHARLPSITTLPAIAAVLQTDGQVTGYLFRISRNLVHETSCESTRYVLYDKVTVCSSSSDSWTAMIVFYLGRLAFASAGDERWSLLQTQYEIRVLDVTYHRGRFYSLHNDGSVSAWTPADGASPQASFNVQHLRLIDVSIVDDYLVGSGDDLLRVSRWRDPLEGDEHRSLRFRVFRLAESGWVAVQSLGERALFVGSNRGISLSTVAFPEFKADCIYFANSGDVGICHLKHGLIKPRGAGVPNLKDGFIVPDYMHRWPPPIWFTPRAC
ncbi:hypothetical protein B296_00004298 [Ensete ventricosum]|uniref:KIB1-4 beta-propeller domain-containing protein n=1 Tax=Ensete ventricosum TaxID=4639 RepID=A0A427B629_ENSVE|nr:hypothetical protein B296_00004298 [Ensete ventricosum]